MLMIVYMSNFLDRQIMAVLAAPIARDLSLNDTRIGLMTGLAFALFYTFRGLPIARYADRPTTNRVWVISASLAVWSLMTALSGAAQNFAQILLARVGVGVGEAGGTPPAHSLITDTAPPEKSATALSIYQLGVPLGAMLGMVIGGMLVEPLGWRMSFVAVGLPGLLLALAVLILLRDPRTSAFAGLADPPAQSAHSATAASIREALGFIFASRTMVQLLAMTGLASFAGYGMLIWTVIFFQRSHGLSAGDTGIWYGIVNGIASALGVWLGGFLADRMGRKSKASMLKLPMLALVLQVPFSLTAFTIADWRFSMALLFPAVALSYLYLAPLIAVVHGVVPRTARAMVSAVMLFVQNLIGLGLGPTLMGWFSDVVRPEFGAESVRVVLYAGAFVPAVAGLFGWAALRHVNAEYGRYG